MASTALPRQQGSSGRSRQREYGEPRRQRWRRPGFRAWRATVCDDDRRTLHGGRRFRVVPSSTEWSIRPLARRKAPTGATSITIMSVMILVGTEVFGVAFAAGWAIAGLLELGSTFELCPDGPVQPVARLHPAASLWRQRVAVEPITSRAESYRLRDQGRSLAGPQDHRVRSSRHIALHRAALPGDADPAIRGRARAAHHDFP